MFESPVQSGLLTPRGATADWTGCSHSQFLCNHGMDSCKLVLISCLTVHELVVTSSWVDWSRPHTYVVDYRSTLHQITKFTLWAEAHHGGCGWRGMGLVDSEVAVHGEAVVMVRKERRGREGPYSPQTPFTCLMVLSLYIYIGYCTESFLYLRSIIQ